MMYKMKKLKFILGLVVILVISGIVYFKFYFPVATDGVKSGELNYLVYKGYLFKTYEGKLIQAGFRSKGLTSGVQSNEFDFSIEDPNVARELMKHSGKVVSLRYRQYNGMLPWRGMQKNIVFAIDNVEPRNQQGIEGSTMEAVEAVSNQVFSNEL